jgi:hypothetical protein
MGQNKLKVDTFLSKTQNVPMVNRYPTFVKTTQNVEVSPSMAVVNQLLAYSKSVQGLKGKKSKVLVSLN